MATIKRTGSVATIATCPLVGIKATAASSRCAVKLSVQFGSVQLTSVQLRRFVHFVKLN